MHQIFPSSGGGGGTTYPQVPPGAALPSLPAGTPTEEGAASVSTGTGFATVEVPGGAWAFGWAEYASHADQMCWSGSTHSDNTGWNPSPGQGVGWRGSLADLAVLERGDTIGIFVGSLDTAIAVYDYSILRPAGGSPLRARLTSTAIEVSADGGLTWADPGWSSRATLEALTGSLTAAPSVAVALATPTRGASAVLLGAL